MDTVSALPLGIHGDFFLASLSIIFINIILSGDNSVVIAMAVNTLPPEKRTKGLIIGTGAACIMRVGLTWFAAQLLKTPFIKLVGGGLILWIAVKLLFDNEEAKANKKKVDSLWRAVYMILVADASMSIDNVLAVAGASKGNAYLLWFGLGLSIPLVIFASSMLSKLMDRFPFIVVAGAALLGKIAGEMIVTDPFLLNWLPDETWVHHTGEAVGIIAILWVAWWAHRQAARGAAEGAADGPEETNVDDAGKPYDS